MRIANFCNCSDHQWGRCLLDDLPTYSWVIELVVKLTKLARPGEVSVAPGPAFRLYVAPVSVLGFLRLKASYLAVRGHLSRSVLQPLVGGRGKRLFRDASPGNSQTSTEDPHALTETHIPD